MLPVFELRELEPSLLWRDDTDIRIGVRFHGAVSRRYAHHRFTLPTYHVTARNVVLDPVTAMALHEGAPLPWSCFFGATDMRVPGDWTAAMARERNGRQHIPGRRVYCGFNRHHRNYAHWITQCVPAIAGYATEPEFAEGVLLLPAENANYERLLALAGIPLPEIVRVEGDCPVAVDELVYSSLLLHHYAPSLLARRVFDRLIEACAGDVDPSANDRIYVWRIDSGARPMSNEDELVDRLAASGVEPIIPATMSVEQQIARFHAARLVIGPHGAGLGNIVFCRPKSIMYELIPEHWTDSFVGPSINLFAQLAGMHYWGDAHPAHGTFAQFGDNVPWTADVDVTFARLAEIEARYALRQHA